MDKVIYNKPNEIREIDGIRIGAFDPSFLRPGDRYYSEKKRVEFRALFKKLRPNVLANLLPPSIVMQDESADIWVCDGNHRVEAADFSVKPAIGIILGTQDELDRILEIADENKKIWNATELLRARKIVRIEQLKAHIAEVREALNKLGIATFDNYREKACEISNSPGYRKDIRYR